MLGLLCNLIALILYYNCVKGLRVTKIVNEIKFERVWGSLKQEIVSRDKDLQNTRD